MTTILRAEEATMTTTTATRTWEGTTIPAAGSYAIDPAHSTVEFVARHLMVSKVRGGFARFEGAITVADRPEASSLEVTIDPASITTGADDRDAHLRSGDFLDVERFPQMTYRSSAVERTAGGWRVLGDLTIRDVTRPVPMDVEFLGAITDPWGNPKSAFSARAEIDREAFGLTWNVALESGGVLVGKKVAIEIEVQMAPSA
jgi:polyisoprenoid-binding protein YceI